jgi:decaprenylphospho-beta-D-erythro-pentofuranosid-2-ulose 2-reductase
MHHVLILGASSDIAQAIAKIFAEKGYGLILAGRNTEQLDVIGKDLHIRHEVPVVVQSFDAINFESHSAFYESLSEKPLITVCVFGYLGEQATAQTEWKECEKIIHTNYTGAVSMLNIIAEDYAQKQAGCMVGISSVAGERGRQSNYVYGSAKAAFTAYLSGLRNRLYKKGVHVVTVKPGFVDTRMTQGLNLPKPITAQPQQVAKAVYKAVIKKKNTIYTLAIWQLIMLIIRNIPEPVFKRLNM